MTRLSAAMTDEIGSPGEPTPKRAAARDGKRALSAFGGVR